MNSGQRTDSPHRIVHDHGTSQVVFAHESIRGRSSWGVDPVLPTIIVHLKGKMDELDSRIDGRDRNLQPASPGDIWVLPPGCQYRAEALGGDIFYAEAVIDFSQWGLTQSDIENIKPAQGIRDEFMYRCLEQISRLSNHPDSDLASMTEASLMSALAHTLATNHASVRKAITPRRGGLSPKQKKRTEEFVRDNLNCQISLGQLAELNRLSVHQFLTAFGLSFNTSPTQYILDQRIHKARWMLANTNLAIGEIALEAGFCNQSHLAVHFKKRMAMQPREFRSQAR